MLTRSQFVRLSALTLGGSLAVTAPLAAQTISPEELAELAENASTKADHLKLAGHYAAEAEQLREDASRHDGMAKRYRRLPPKAAPRRTGLVSHCDDLVKSLQNAAKAADQLAAEHHEMAGESK